MSSPKPGGPDCLCASPAPVGHWSLCPVAKLQVERDSLAARVSSLEACAQEVRRAWDAREAKCAEYEAWHAKNKRKHDEAGAYQLDDEKEAAEARWQAAIDALVAPVSRRRRSP